MNFMIQDKLISLTKFLRFWVQKRNNFEMPKNQFWGFVHQFANNVSIHLQHALFVAFL